MKKLSFLLVFAIFCIIGTVAQEFTYGDFEFTINNDNETVTLLGHVDGYAATGQITIPSLAYYNGNGYIVTIIDSQAFYYSEGLTGTLLIPGPLRTLGNFSQPTLTRKPGLEIFLQPEITRVPSAAYFNVMVNSFLTSPLTL